MMEDVLPLWKWKRNVESLSIQGAIDPSKSGETIKAIKRNMWVNLILILFKKQMASEQIGDTQIFFKLTILVICPMLYIFK